MSKLEVDAIEPQSGTTLTIGASGDTVNIASGATITDFTSTGIDDNATSTAITIDSSENVGIGTSSPNSQLDITNTTGATGLELHRNFSGDVSGATNAGGLDFTLTDTATSNQVVARINSQGEAGTGDAFGGIMRFFTSDSSGTSTERMRIDSSGNVGIGTSTPTTIASDTSVASGDIILNVKSSGDARIVAEGTNGGSLVLVDSNATTNQKVVRLESTGGKLSIQGDSDTAIGSGSGAGSIIVADLSNGNVGIGTSSPSQKLHVVDGGIKIESTSATGNAWYYAKNADRTWLMGVRGSSSDALSFYDLTADTERMRIDSSGNVLVGKTSTTYSDDGLQLNPEGLIGASDTNSISAIFNRNGTDGDIVNFRKDGTTVGSIGSEGGDSLYILNGDTGLRFSGGADAIIPVTTAGAARDNAIDLGSSGARFDDIFATNATIQTSDQNEKQSIQSLTTAEMNVAKRLSSLIKTFKWNSSVEEKGDSARTHTGIIAQDVQQAFTDEGLDASNYALFCSDTWWEKEISVDAVQEVQAQEATYDEEGNELTPAIEAVEPKDAYTYMDTKEEATDGYTERTRLGVRYPELLSFIQAYNDQRFTELEARITTLENA